MVVVVVSRRTSVLEDYQSPFAIAPAAIVGASGPDARVVEHSRTWVACGLASPVIGPYSLTTSSHLCPNAINPIIEK
jgi:hypothetical protein